MKIAGRSVGEGYPPYIVAEIGASHNGEMRNALGLIKEAALCGADAAKIQLYSAFSLSEQRGGADKEIIWNGKATTLYRLYADAYTPSHWFPSLFAYGKEIGITVFSSIFRKESRDFLVACGNPAYKVSAYEGDDYALINAAASTGDPVILSVRDDQDAGQAYMAAINGGATEIAILHCVSKYPCPPEEANVGRIGSLRKQFPVVGFSDHTLGNEAALMALGYGAVMFEKHIKMWGDTTSPDAGFAITPDAFADYVRVLRSAYDKRKAA